MYIDFRHEYAKYFFKPDAEPMMQRALSLLTTTNKNSFPTASHDIYEELTTYKIHNTEGG